VTEERFTEARCFAAMADVSYCRERANHLRRLAETTSQRDLAVELCRLAQEYDETVEDLEAGAIEIRHPYLLRRDQRPRSAGYRSF
jgi:hypothetical protein